MSKKKIVYILGAGFSAPLGLPLMSNFLEKAKDIYFSDKEEKYSGFKKIIETIDKLSYCKNYYNSDLFNIEEILSIIEMGRSLGFKKDYPEFTKFIEDVITYYTPKIESEKIREPDLSNSLLFGKLSAYAGLLLLFIGSKLFVRYSGEHTIPDYAYNMYHFNAVPLNNESEYSVITFNYDLVLENIIIHLKESCGCMSLPDIKLAKLHGCISKNNIVSPTWNKSLHEGIEAEWKKAFTYLKEANCVRVIGYSLPETDSYVKYLLKSSVIGNKNLKEFDVICLDDSEKNVERRYRNFISWNKLRFFNIRTEEYLRNFEINIKSENPNSTIAYPVDDSYFTNENLERMPYILLPNDGHDWLVSQYRPGGYKTL